MNLFFPFLIGPLCPCPVLNYCPNVSRESAISRSDAKAQSTTCVYVGSCKTSNPLLITGSRPYSNRLAFSSSVDITPVACLESDSNLLAYCVTVIFPCLRARNSRANSCLIGSGNYFSLNRRSNSFQVIPSTHLDFLIIFHQ